MIGATETGRLTSVGVFEILGAITALCPGLVNSAGHSRTGLVTRSSVPMASTRYRAPLHEEHVKGKMVDDLANGSARSVRLACSR